MLGLRRAPLAVACVFMGCFDPNLGIYPCSSEGGCPRGQTCNPFAAVPVCSLEAEREMVCEDWEQIGDAPNGEGELKTPSVPNNGSIVALHTTGAERTIVQLDRGNWNAGTFAPVDWSPEDVSDFDMFATDTTLFVVASKLCTPNQCPRHLEICRVDSEMSATGELIPTTPSSSTCMPMDVFMMDAQPISGDMDGPSVAVDGESMTMLFNVDDRVWQATDQNDPAVWNARPVEEFSGIYYDDPGISGDGRIVVMLRSTPDPEPYVSFRTAADDPWSAPHLIKNPTLRAMEDPALYEVSPGAYELFGVVALSPGRRIVRSRCTVE